MNQSEFLERLFSSNETNTNKHLILHKKRGIKYEILIDSLVKVCKHTIMQAQQCCLISEFNGQCDIKIGKLEELKLMKKKLDSRGLKISIE
ncbi:MAG: ATP-dependent Clp protease adaptor ClpS [Marinifilaceae bacterium]|jgi:ATP-dependent Clp protease adaptor protein ClpS|nr:ATP-dependent Clp protease adaptor ClpS [Marinifilaceae bacterium]